MYENEEKKLREYGSRLGSKPAPDLTDEYILKGMRKGQQMKKQQRTKLFSLLSAAVFIVVFSTSVRISPAFAAAASKIPGLGYIVKLINHDRGITDAVNNDFVQHIGIAQEHEDLTLTIKDIICDESKLLLFYNLENKGNHRVVKLQEMRFTDEQGKILEAGVSWGYGAEIDMNETKQYDHKVELNFGTDFKIPETLNVSVKLVESQPYDSVSQLSGKENSFSANHSEAVPGRRDNHSVILASTWTFKLHLDSKKFSAMKTIHQIDKEVEIEGQRILFKKLTITPTLASLEIEYDKQNSKRMLNFDDISLMDENGDKWGTIMNGVSGSRADEYHQTLYFQSNYFRNPKELYITGKSIRAVDVLKGFVKVDVNKKQLISAPDDNLKLVSIKSSGNKLYLDFTLKTDIELDQHRGYSLFGEIKDSDGKSLKLVEETSGSSYGDNLQQIGICVESVNEKAKANMDTDTNNQSHTLYLKINDYPQRIHGMIHVKVK